MSDDDGWHLVRLFFIDEFGHFVQAVLDPQSHAHYRREVMTQLTVLSTSATETVIGTEYANQEERPRQDICEPCVCIYGTTVPHTFGLWQGFGPKPHTCVRGRAARWVSR